MLKTLKVKIDHLLSQQDKLKLWSLSYDQVKVYNTALEQAKEDSFDFKKLHEVGKNVRHELGLMSHSKVAQNTVIRLINNWKGFLSLSKTDSTAKAPKRYASTWKFQPLLFDWNTGCGGFKLGEFGITISMPKMAFQLPEYAHQVLRQADYKVQTLTIFQQDDEFYISFCLKEECEFALNQANWLSIDPGLINIVSLVTSKGKAILYKNTQFKWAEKQALLIQSKLDRKIKYSRRYKKLRTLFKSKKRKVAHKNIDFQHKVTADIINLCHEHDIGTIIYGDIKTKQLTKAKNASRGLNKSSQNRGTLGRVKGFLQYKAGFNGITFNLVDEAYTSKTNCLTGALFKGLKLGDRSVDLKPDLKIDRDINGAVNIAKKFQGSWSPQETWLRELDLSQRYV